MIRIGEVHCHWCGDSFEPEGLPSFEGPNFCSDECAMAYDNDQADFEARYGSAPVFP